MMLDIDFAELKKGALQYLPFGGLIGLVLVAELVMAAGAWTLKPAAGAARAHALPAGISNTRALGHIIYTDYVYYFQIAGLVLLVAMIGAIVLTLRTRPGVRRQVIAAQNARTAAMSVDMLDIKPGQGAGQEDA
jgi:NADH-quinone oxidoreductase subunit J